MLFIFFIVSRLVNIRSCKSSELIPSFMKWYTILLTLQVLSKLGMKQQLENQARAQRKDNSIYTKQLTAHVHVIIFCMVNCMVIHALPMSMQCFFWVEFFCNFVF
jgi:hypothetical protein